MPTDRTGVVFFAHGSPIESANEAVRQVARDAAAQGGFDLYSAAFLESGVPDLPAAVGALRDQGASRVVVVPYFLTLGLHLQRDLPRIVAGLAGIYTDIEIVCTAPLDGHPALAGILAERARDAFQQ